VEAVEVGFGVVVFLSVLAPIVFLNWQTDYLKDDPFYVRRKIQHSTSCFLIILFRHILSFQSACFLLFCGCVFIFSIHSLRLLFPAFNRYLIQTYGPILRKHEHHSLPGAFYVLLGTLIVLLFYPYPLNILAIIGLAVGDPCGGYLGSKYGRCGRRFRNGKSVVGLVANVVSTTLTCFVYFALVRNRVVMPPPSPSSVISSSLADPIMSVSVFVLWEWSLLTGLTAGLVEVVPFCGADDNLLVPVVTGLMLSMMQFVGGLTAVSLLPALSPLVSFLSNNQNDFV